MMSMIKILSAVALWFAVVYLVRAAWSFHVRFAVPRNEQEEVARGKTNVPQVFRTSEKFRGKYLKTG